LTNFIISQILIGLAIVCIFISFWQKDNKKLLFWLCLSHILQATGFLFLESWVGAALFYISALRSFSFFLLSKYHIPNRKLLSITTLIVFLAAAVIATALTWQINYEWFVLAAILLFTFGCWQKSNHVLKIITIVYAAILIGYEVIIGNYTGIGLRAVYFFAVGFFYIKLYLEHRKTKLNLQNQKEHE
jgi:hypothetical protein